MLEIVNFTGTRNLEFEDVLLLIKNNIIYYEK
jgi:hypothetical protein